MSLNDPEPDQARSGPSAWLIAVIAVAIIVIVALHLTGVVGPG